MTKKNLRLGLLLDSPEVPSWFLSAIQKTLATGCVDLVLLVELQVEPSSSSFADRLWAERGRGVQLLHERVDQRLFPVQAEAFARRDVRPLVGDAPSVAIASGELSADEAEAIKGFELDVLVQAGEHPLGGVLLALPRQGVWGYRWGEGAGYWETVKALPETETFLKRLGDDTQPERVLYRSWAPTDLLSIHRNRNAAYWTAASFLSRQLALLHRLGPAAFFEAVQQYERAELNSAVLPDAPGNRAGAAQALRHLGRLSRKVGQKLLFNSQWFLLYAFQEGFPDSLRGFEAIVPPKDRFWADPHVVAQDGRYFLFVEELLFETNRGHIAVMELSSDGRITQPVPVLQRDYHLSYPFVLKVDGVYYLIPESMENGTIELYESVNFPYDWRFKMNLMTGVAAADATVYFRDGLWWLFVAMAEHRGAGACEELFVFSSKELLSDSWEPHPLNPVVSDVRSARPAGALFERDGKLFRPSQDCSGTYGAAVVLNEITALSPTAYEETKVARLSPDWSQRTTATHTFSAAPGLVVVDANTLRAKFF
jgi:hypothetical protein